MFVFYLFVSLWCFIMKYEAYNGSLVSSFRLVEVTCYGSQTGLYDLETAVPSVLKPDLTDVWVSDVISPFPPNTAGLQNSVREKLSWMWKVKKCWWECKTLQAVNPKVLISYPDGLKGGGVVGSCLYIMQIENICFRPWSLKCLILFN